MKAILVTQQLKDLNPDYFKKDALDSIKRISSIPKSFYSLTYNAGRRTDGYDTLAPATHRADGFFSVVTPTYDETIEYLGVLIFDEPNQAFTYTVETYTVGELADKEEKKAKDDFKGTLQGVFMYATSPSGLEYAISIDDGGKIETTLIP